MTQYERNAERMISTHILYLSMSDLGMITQAEYFQKIKKSILRNTADDFHIWNQKCRIDLRRTLHAEGFSKASVEHNKTAFRTFLKYFDKLLPCKNWNKRVRSASII